jgi:hypothetical protein
MYHSAHTTLGSEQVHMRKVYRLDCQRLSNCLPGMYPGILLAGFYKPLTGQSGLQALVCWTLFSELVRTAYSVSRL